MVEGKGYAKRPHQTIQETIAGVLREQVINPNSEFYFNGYESLIPNNDDQLYRL